MNDLTERLHNACVFSEECLELRIEAADEIERLVADNALLQVAIKRSDNIEKHRDELFKKVGHLTAENQRLVEALELSIHNKEQAELIATRAHQKTYYKALKEQNEKD